MMTFDEVVAEGFETVMVGPHPYHSFTFGDGYELAIEPLLFDRTAIALYHNGELILPDKLVVQPVVRRQER